MTPSRLPWVIPEYCEGCTACVGACPKHLLLMHDRAEDEQIPWLEDPSACTGCGRCAEACGLGGIAMTEYVEEAAKRFLARAPARAVPISSRSELLLRGGDAPTADNPPS
jgi:ferredoxin